MKNFLVCIIITFFLISCSTDEDVIASVTPIADSENASVMPQNLLNPMDSTGKNYYDMLSEYSQLKVYPNSIRDMGDQIRFMSRKLHAKGNTSRGKIFFSDEIVEAIMINPDSCMIAIVEASTLSLGRKTSLINFLQALIGQRTNEFNVAYDFIVSYESIIISDVAIDEEEKETLLTVTSISRYSLYSETARKDRDWETSVASRKARPFFATNEVAIISIIALLPEIL